jgi:tetratricopeptide (TPR) repeat protein
MSDQPRAVGAKRAKRSVRWELNKRLLIASLVALALLLLIGVGLYRAQSQRLAESIIQKADQARAASDWEAEIRWLQRSALLQPDDTQISVRLALASDAAVELPPANRLDRVDRARTNLRNALARELSPKQELDLRRKLVLRLGQYAGRYADQVQNEIVLLNPPEDDATMLRAMALALASQADAKSASGNSKEEYRRDQQFWMWLTQQPSGDFLQLAWNANRDDLTLAAMLLDECLRERPRFAALADDKEAGNEGQEDNEKDAASDFDPLALAAQLTSHLKTMPNSGQAQWILYQFEQMQKQDPDRAAQRLASVAGPALERLHEHAKQVRDESNDGESDEITMPILAPAQPDRKYVAAWDFELVLLSALRRISPDALDEDRVVAIDQLDQLIEFPEMQVSSSTIESAYLTRGQLLLESEQADQAWRLWASGIERLGDESLRLQLARASSLSDQGSRDNAEAAVEQLADLVRRRSLALAGPAGANLTQARRSQLQNELDGATWTVGLLRGQNALSRGDLPRAVSHLQSALDSQFTVSDPQRLRSAVLLAAAHERAGTWDLAATAHERALNLAPDQDQYRVAAAQAWARAGDNARSFQQWGAIKGSSPQLAIARAQSLIVDELAKPPGDRDFSNAGRAIELLRQQLPTLPEEMADQRAQLESQVELLALAIPDRQDGGDRAAAIERLSELSKQHPDNSELQSVTAISLAAVGKTEESAQALARLAEAAGQQTFVYQQTLARTSAMRGDAETGIQSLTAFAAAHPDDAAASLELAADLAQTLGSMDRAYQLLKQIPADKRSLELTFRLFTLAMLPDVEPAATEGAAQQPAIQWENELRSKEGESGTWWRLALATRLLAEFDRQNPNEADRGLVDQAQSLQTQIRSARPRWGLGHSLEGQIAARRGESQRAIDSLRRGMAGGDRRVSTVLLLVSQLNQANRVAEAEAELSRVEQLTSSNSTVTALAVAIAEKKGDLRQGLDLARASAESSPRDISAWLLLGQAAMLAARSTEEKDAKESLVAEARRALDEALQLSDNSSLPAYQLRVRFQAAFFGNEGVRNELQRALESNLAEPTRSLFVGLTYVELKDTESAQQILNRALRIAPQDPNVYLAMSDYYRLIRDDAKNVEMLEKAFELGPARVDIRNRLALAIALRDGADVPWNRLDQLLGDDAAQSSPNKLLHALILMNRGDEERQNQASRLLREMIRVGDPLSDDATRMLAALERRRWSVASSADPKSAEAQRAMAEARTLYTVLTRRADPAPMDLYRFGDLLLRAEQTADVKGIADRLDQITQGSPIALELRLRLAQQLGQEEEAARLAKAWAERAISSGSMLEASAWETAGRALSNLGYHEEALRWLGQAYEEDPSNFRGFVVGLARGRQFDRALEICQKHFAQTKDPEAIALMGDVVILSGNFSDVPDEVESVFQDALVQFNTVPRLVESIATLRLAQQRYPESITLYEQAEKLAPTNVRVLNNLAMALSEIPGRVGEAIPKIQKAIDLYGRSPELLDTQGLVLLRNDRIDEAVKALREATENSTDPRYRFHLLMALMRTGNKVESLAQWAQLDIKSLKESALTPAERRDLETMQKEFARRRES